MFPRIFDKEGKGYAHLDLCTFTRRGRCHIRLQCKTRSRRSRDGQFPACAYVNLAVYFVHGVSAGGAIPLTLQEALAKGSVQVVETGRVNELQIENTGSEEVFIQAGDIVKGGRQDRVLTVSFVLPPKSGQVPIASFCVEQGRWSARGKEDQFKFSSAHEAMPSRAALLAMITPSEPEKTEPVANTESGGQAQTARARWQ